MKNIIKIALTVSLLTGTLMADGQMGSGGCNGENCPPPSPPCTENCNRPVVEDEPVLIKIVKGFARLYYSRY